MVLAVGLYPRLMAMATVGSCAEEVRSMLAVTGAVAGEDLWRFGVLQLLDDYESMNRHDGVQAAADLLLVEPALTGHSGVDAAFAALACWLADRDGWSAPGWAVDPARVARPWWFVSSSSYGRAWAMVQSPAQFRIRGVFITDTALHRA